MKLTEQPTVSFTVTFELSEREARALQALTVYGADAFLKVFYEQLGESSLKPHELGLRSLFDGVYQQGLNDFFERVKAARTAFGIK